MAKGKKGGAKARLKDAGSAGSEKEMKAEVKKSAGGGGRFWFINNDGIQVRFMDEPHTWFKYNSHYDSSLPKGEQNIPCTEDCDGCRDGLDRRKRYVVNTIDRKESRHRLLEMPMSAVKQIWTFYEKNKTVLDRDFELSKEGTGMDTEYAALHEDKSKCNLDKYMDQWKSNDDIEDIILGAADDSDDKPKKSKGKKSEPESKSKDKPKPKGGRLGGGEGKKAKEKEKPKKTDSKKAEPKKTLGKKKKK